MRYRKKGEIEAVRYTEADQAERYQAIRTAAKELAELIVASATDTSRYCTRWLRALQSIKEDYLAYLPEKEEENAAGNAGRD